MDLTDVIFEGTVAEIKKIKTALEKLPEINADCKLKAKLFPPGEIIAFFAAHENIPLKGYSIPDGSTNIRVDMENGMVGFTYQKTKYSISS